jgi:hypothetical protein
MPSRISSRQVRYSRFEGEGLDDGADQTRRLHKLRARMLQISGWLVATTMLMFGLATSLDRYYSRNLDVGSGQEFGSGSWPQVLLDWSDVGSGSEHGSGSDAAEVLVWLYLIPVLLMIATAGTTLIALGIHAWIKILDIGQDEVSASVCAHTSAHTHTHTLSLRGTDDLCGSLPASYSVYRSPLPAVGSVQGNRSPAQRRTPPAAEPRDARWWQVRATARTHSWRNLQLLTTHASIRWTTVPTQFKRALRTRSRKGYSTRWTLGLIERLRLWSGKHWHPFVHCSVCCHSVPQPVTQKLILSW